MAAPTLATVARALVILPTGGYHTADYLGAANALGIELTIASEQPDLLADPDRFVLIDCGRPEESAEAIIDLAVKTPIDAIVAADDAGVEIAARAASRLGLPAHSPRAAALSRNKAALRRQLSNSEVAQPAFEVVTPGAAEAAARRLGFPVVVKPRTLTASRGVIRADDPEDLTEAVEHLQEIRSEAGEDTESPLVVERFVPGAEFSLEGVTWDGELEVLAVMEKPDPLDGPYFQETMFVTPPRISEQTRRGIVDTVRRAVRALGFGDGPVHAEIRVGRDGPVLIEAAARTIGGLCGRALRFGLMGTSLEAVVLRNALGMRRRLPPNSGAAGASMIPIPAAGMLESVDGVDAATAMPGVVDVEISAAPGASVAPPPHGDRYLGFIIARGDDTDQVIDRLRRATEAIRVTVAPSDAVR